MRGFIESIVLFSKDILGRYKIEVLLLIASAISSLLAIALFLYSPSRAKKEETAQLKVETKKYLSTKDQKIFVHIAGAVVKPDVYEMSFGARIKDILHRAGGLSDLADKEFFFRNFNLSRVLTDQEKIYIPSIQDVAEGRFREETKILNYNDPGRVTTSISENEYKSPLINLNLATADELETISGIGKSLSLKIIQNRPYRSIEELLSKQVLNKNLFEKIKLILTI